MKLKNHLTAEKPPKPLYMNKKLRFLILFLLAIAQFYNPESAYAQAPGLINFQTRVAGVPAGTAALTFSIYNDALGGERLWQETQSVEILDDGIISVLLGSDKSIPMSVFGSVGERYLAINISGEDLLPRFRLTSVPYAYRAEVADQLNNDIIENLNTTVAMLAAKLDSLTAVENGKKTSLKSSLPGGPVRLGDSDSDQEKTLELGAEADHDFCYVELVLIQQNAVIDRGCQVEKAEGKWRFRVFPWTICRANCYKLQEEVGG